MTTTLSDLIAAMRARCAAHAEGAEWVPAQPDLPNALDALGILLETLDAIHSNNSWVSFIDFQKVKAEAALKGAKP